MGNGNSKVVITPATKSDCRRIAPLMLQRRADEPRFGKLARSTVQRFLYERWAAPRFLSRTADTFRADINGEMVGYLVLLYDHPSTAIVDVVALDGFKEQGIEESLLLHAERTSRDRDYPYLRAGLAPGDDAVRRFFSQVAFQPLDFRRWEFVGTVEASETPEGLTMRSMLGKPALERQAHYMRAELDAAQPHGRDLIEAHYIPKRPLAAQSFELVFDDTPFGYLSTRRDKGTYTLHLSILPEWWGHEMEPSLVTSFPTAAARSDVAHVRVRLDSTPHADAAAEAMASLGLQRELVDPDVWYKHVGTDTGQRPASKDQGDLR